MGDVGVLTVIDAKTGARTHQERIGGVYSASPVAGDGKICLLSEDGETIVLAAGGRLFIRSDNALFAIGR